MSDMDGKVALVTGGAAGIGHATALAFARNGASVVVSDLDDTRGSEVAAAIEANGGAAHFVRTDVADQAQVQAMVAETIEKFGRLDYAFNNAGIEGSAAPTAEMPRANWDQVLAVNLTGAFLCMQAEIPHLLAAGEGSAIVNCASVAGLVGTPGMCSYTASKHGLIGLTKSAALELAPAGVRVNAVCPGVIATEMIDRVSAEMPEMLDGIVAAHPLGRMGRPEEVADTVVWLCSPGSGFVTGHALTIDGGYTTQ